MHLRTLLFNQYYLYTHAVPGLELATELASTVQPLISVCSTPLHEINNFFTSLTNVELNFDPIIPDDLTPINSSRSNTPSLGHSKSLPEKRLSASPNDQSAGKSIPEGSLEHGLIQEEANLSEKLTSRELSQSPALNSNRESILQNSIHSL